MRLQSQARRRRQLLNEFVGHLGHTANVHRCSSCIITQSIPNIVNCDSPLLKGQMQTIELAILLPRTAAAILTASQEQLQFPAQFRLSAKNTSKAVQEEHFCRISIRGPRITHAVQEVDRVPRIRALGEVRDDADEGVDADAAGDKD